jgi:hypothetical protein
MGLEANHRLSIHTNVAPVIGLRHYDQDSHCLQ